LAFLQRTDQLTVAVAPYPLPLHYLYYFDRYYSVLCFLELGVQVLRVVLVLLAQLELLLRVMDQILLQVCFQLLALIDHL
jgi:hypothetical protein